VKISDYIGEATEHDKKEMLEERKPKSWLKSVSAFANGIGGSLIFGVNNNEELVGVKDIKHDSEVISKFVKTKLDPIPKVVLENHTEDGKDFIVLKVLAGQETPYYYFGEGNRTAFVRVGNESIPATPHDLKQLVLHGSDITFDSLSSRHRMNDFTFIKLRSAYKKRLGKELMDSDFLSFGLVNENDILTNAGALFADESPIRQSRVFCTRWHGLNKASGVIDAIDDKEFSGSIITLLQNSEEFVKNNSKKPWKKTSTGRVEMPDYPERAVLECIVNGIIHRDYLVLGSEVHIDMYDDRLEIYSPGGMFGGALVQELDTNEVPSRRRNPIIADVFNRLDYMERRGSGFRKINEDYNRMVNYRESLKPKFRSDNQSFWVTLYNLNYGTLMEKQYIVSEKQYIGTEKQYIGAEKQYIEGCIEKMVGNAPSRKNAEKVFNEFKGGEIFGRNEVMMILNITQTPASKLLKKMLDAEIIVVVKGSGKGRYQVNNGCKEGNQK